MCRRLWLRLWLNVFIPRVETTRALQTLRISLLLAAAAAGRRCWLLRLWLLLLLAADLSQWSGECWLAFG